VQARRLASVKRRRQRATASVLVERDNIALLKTAIVNRESESSVLATRTPAGSPRCAVR